MIVRADARHIPLADGSVQCVVTSPPYFGLRDYGVAGQIGLESTLEEYVAVMVAVFREIRRVLRTDGVAWLNLGDSYAGSWGNYHPNSPPGKYGQRAKESERWNRPGYSSQEFLPPTANLAGLKPKDLCMIPARVALALQADGWYLRSDIIWAKPNPMPESVTDRPTRSHEYLFLLAKSERYYYDAEAIKEQAIHEGETSVTTAKSMSYAQAVSNGKEPSGNGKLGSIIEIHGRNKRDVWTVNSEPTPEAHFATFPQKLIEPCILAGTSEKGCCAECGAPRVRLVERTKYEPPTARDGERFVDASRGDKTRKLNGAEYNRQVQILGESWQPSCAHDAPSVPCVVFDPFLGSGTVGKVCERLGRRWAGLELSAGYIEIAKKRTAQRGLFNGTRPSV